MPSGIEVWCECSGSVSVCVNDTFVLNEAAENLSSDVARVDTLKEEDFCRFRRPRQDLETTAGEDD